jgi:hypothetical protein
MEHTQVLNLTRNYSLLMQFSGYEITAGGVPEGPSVKKWAGTLICLAKVFL